MKARYKYIHFIKADPTLFQKVEGHSIHICKNNKSKEDLGYIVWDKIWKTYVFSQATDAIIFTPSCLIDIADYATQLSGSEIL